MTLAPLVGEGGKGDEGKNRSLLPVWEKESGEKRKEGRRTHLTIKRGTLLLLHSGLIGAMIRKGARILHTSLVSLKITHQAYLSRQIVRHLWKR